MIKKISTLFLFCIALSWQLQAQDQVPAAVLNTFGTMFPTATDVEWEFEDEQWDAEFVNEGQALEAAFSPAGNWLETEREIDVQDVPEPVMTIMIKFAGYEVAQASELSTPDTPLVYELLVRSEQDAVEVTVDPRGYVLRMQPATDEDEDEGDDQ
ncbi:MAG: PepSY-like domain-containing protein [Saprospiraceae bacterium]|nr:PepSY-like domain-containing protein [Saprospiraceae bacterium]